MGEDKQKYISCLSLHGMYLLWCCHHLLKYIVISTISNKCYVSLWPALSTLLHLMGSLLDFNTNDNFFKVHCPTRCLFKGIMESKKSLPGV